MLKVTYEMRQDETGKVEDIIIKSFKDKDEKYNWEIKQTGHPFLHLKQISCEEVE